MQVREGTDTNWSKFDEKYTIAMTTISVGWRWLSFVEYVVYMHESRHTLQERIREKKKRKEKGRGGEILENDNTNHTTRKNKQKNIRRGPRAH